MIGLAGYLAEKMIFGKENTCSGVYSDMEKATSLATRAVTEYAMGDEPFYIRLESVAEQYSITQKERHNQEIIALIKECEQKAERILQRNKTLLLKLAEYLTYNSRMNEELIKEYVLAYAAEEWVCETAFVKKEAYFNFAEIVKEAQESVQQPFPINSNIHELVC